MNVNTVRPTEEMTEELMLVDSEDMPETNPEEEMKAEKKVDTGTWGTQKPGANLSQEQEKDRQERQEGE